MSGLALTLLTPGNAEEEAPWAPYYINAVNRSQSKLRVGLWGL